MVTKKQKMKDFKKAYNQYEKDAYAGCWDALDGADDITDPTIKKVLLKILRACGGFGAMLQILGADKQWVELNAETVKETPDEQPATEQAEVNA